jgi:hypothetical protein
MSKNESQFTAGIGSDASKDPVRIVFITKKTSARVQSAARPQVMSYPHVILREIVAFQILTIVLVLIALFWDAPLEQLADPLMTPNPAKAPWYFLGLQEMLHYFHPIVAGILIPLCVIVALVVIPYFFINIHVRPFAASGNRRQLWIFLAVAAVLAIFFGIYEAWTMFIPTLIIAGLVTSSFFMPSGRGGLSEFFRSRSLPWWLMTWFIILSITLTVVGTFFRGPGWSWVWPWR